MTGSVKPIARYGQRGGLFQQGAGSDRSYICGGSPLTELRIKYEKRPFRRDRRRSAYWSRLFVRNTRRGRRRGVRERGFSAWTGSLLWGRGLMLSQALGVGQHEFDPVLLVGSGLRRDHSRWRRCCSWGSRPSACPDHPLAHDVVGQAAEGLGADDVPVPVWISSSISAVSSQPSPILLPSPK